MSLFAAQLPISAGPFGLEFVEEREGGAVLKFFGLERWRGSPEREPFVHEFGVSVPDGPHAELAVRTWVHAVREVLSFAASWPLETEQWLGPADLRLDVPKKPLTTEAEWAAHWRDHFRDLLPPSPELVRAAEVISRLLAADSTVASTDVVSLVAVAFRSGAFAEVRRGVFVTLQLTVFEGGQVRDIKEQECQLIDRGELSPERVEAFLGAWRQSLRRFFVERVEAIETYMPHDLIEQALELARPRTQADFEAVFERRWKLAPQNSR